MTCVSTSRSELSEHKSLLKNTTYLAWIFATGFWTAVVIHKLTTGHINGPIIYLNIIMICCIYIIYILKNYEFTSTTQICKLLFPATSYLIAAIFYMIQTLVYYQCEKISGFYFNFSLSFVWFSFFFTHLILSMKIVRSYPKLPQTPESFDSQNFEDEDKDEPIDMA